MLTIESIFNKKNKNQIVTINIIQTNLQNIIKKNDRTLKQTFMWNTVIKNCFASINYK